MTDPVRKSIPRCRYVPRHAAKCLALFVCTLLWLLTALAHAGVDEETVANNFLRFVGSGKIILSSEILEINLLDSTLPPVVAGHLFHLQDGGYLLVSGDRTISPVKAYSLSGDFAALPEPYRAALLRELELRVRAAREAATGRTPQSAEPTETEARWDFLLGFAGGRTSLAYTQGSWLLQTQWNQQHPYNKFLPQVGGETVVAGCVNVALAQVMRYHRYPAASQGVLSYTWAGPPQQTLKTILNRGYNWDNMPATLDGTTPEYRADEVALLIRDLGIANQTHFGVTGSGASVNSQILLENFGYSTTLVSMFNTDYQAFITAIQTEIQAERPVLLTFPGHMTVADGFISDGAGVRVHVNMGWGGTANDFYFLDEGEIFYDEVNSFPTNPGQLQIHYSIKPCSEADGDCHVNLEPGDGINGLSISGNFDQAGDADLYEVYLKGPTTIAASRGYSNVAFYVSILRADDGTTVFTLPDSDPPGAVSVGGTDGLAAGKYLIRVSLCSTDGSCYGPPASGYGAYTVTLTSTEPTVQEKADIDQALEKAPVIGSVSPDSPLPDLFLNTTAGVRRILIDARDENGDAVNLTVQSSNPAAAGASLEGVAGNILALTPAGAAKTASRITVTASAGGKTTAKAFVVLTDSQDIAFGKSTSVGGTFSTQDEVDTHRAILDGSCTISGNRTGISNQAFYLKIYNAAGDLVASSDGNPGSPGSAFTATFTREIHRLDASLSSSNGYWSYDVSGNNPYTITISCPGADDGTVTIAGILGISLAGVFDQPGDIDDDKAVTLADAILALQILSGVDTSSKTIKLDRDVNSDGRIGLAEAIHALQVISGLRNP